MKKCNHSPISKVLSLVFFVIFIFSLIPVRVEAGGREFSCHDAEQARLMTCGFSMEYGSDRSHDGQETKLSRWENTIKIYVSGSPKQKDLDELNEFIMECATHCPNMPNIRIVNSESQANITIWYGPLDELQYHCEYYVSGNWGAFSYWYDGSNHITKGEVVIASDVNTQDSRNHLLREELVGVFGLTNDHSVYSDSILYTEWTTTLELSDVDWLMLNMLYDPDLKTGMSAGEARRILEGKIAA